MVLVLEHESSHDYETLAIFNVSETKELSSVLGVSKVVRLNFFCLHFITISVATIIASFGISLNLEVHCFKLSYILSSFH